MKVEAVKYPTSLLNALMLLGIAEDVMNPTSLFNSETLEGTDGSSSAKARLRVVVVGVALDLVQTIWFSSPSNVAMLRPSFVKVIEC